MGFVRFALAAAGLIALGCCFSPAVAGLIDNPRQPASINYIETAPASVADPELRRYWQSELDAVTWDSLRKPLLYKSRFQTSGQELVVTMLSSAGLCGIRTCPVRVMTPTGDVLLDVMACDDPTSHSLTPDGKVFIACDNHVAIFENRPRDDGSIPGVTRSRFWHNGSIVEALVFSDRAVEIRYLEPRLGLPVSPGRVLFRGMADRGGRLTGTAYTFSATCADEPYDVAGTMTRNGINLFGAAPHRSDRTCRVLNYTTRSPHARLSFIALGHSASN
jgi:hypothetical protein